MSQRFWLIRQTPALALEEGRIAAISITRTPDKLRALRRGLGDDGG